MVGVTKGGCLLTGPLQTSWLASRPACPVCGYSLDGATGAGVPEPESLTVCAYCGVFLRFTPAMQLEVLTSEEWAALETETRDQLTRYLEITKAWRRSDARSQ